MSDSDPIDLFAKQAELEADALATEKKFRAVTKKLFRTATGRDWLKRAMHRMNFMGSVFQAEDGMNPANAAYRDGMRAVLSDILNSMQTTTTTSRPDDDD